MRRPGRGVRRTRRGSKASGGQHQLRGLVRLRRLQSVHQLSAWASQDPSGGDRAAQGTCRSARARRGRRLRAAPRRGGRSGPRARAGRAWTGSRSGVPNGSSAGGCRSSISSGADPRASSARTHGHAFGEPAELLGRGWRGAGEARLPVVAGHVGAVERQRAWRFKLLPNAVERDAAGLRRRARPGHGALVAAQLLDEPAPDPALQLGVAGDRGVQLRRQRPHVLPMRHVRQRRLQERRRSLKWKGPRFSDREPGPRRTVRWWRVGDATERVARSRCCRR